MRKFFVGLWALVPNAGGLAGLLALASPLIVVLFSPKIQADPNLKLIAEYTVWVLGLSFLTIVILTFLHWDRMGAIEDAIGLRLEVALTREQHREIAGLVHNLTHESRNQLFNVLFARESLASISESERNEVIARFERNWGMFNLYYLDNLKRLFDVLTKDSNAVCIKIMRTEYVHSQASPREGEVPPPPGEKLVHTVKTLYRDTTSYRLRRENDVRLNEYDAHSNTAFAHILSGDTRDFFYLNNACDEDRTYVNTNPRWREFYNAVMVSPIRIENFTHGSDGEQSDRYLIYGFFCVDSLSAKYRKPIELQLLHAFADLYLPVLYAFDLWRKTALALPEEPTSPENGPDLEPGAPTKGQPPSLST